MRKYTGEFVTRTFKTIPACGTKQGYDYHRRGLQEDACEECRQAMMQYWRDFRANPEKGFKERMRRYMNDNSHRKNRTRFKKFAKQGIDIQYEPYALDHVINLYGTNCHICGDAIDLDAPRQVGKEGWEKGLHVDHVIPLSRGGSDTLENVRPSHGQCNIIKSATIL